MDAGLVRRVISDYEVLEGQSPFGLERKTHIDHSGLSVRVSHIRVMPKAWSWGTTTATNRPSLLVVKRLPVRANLDL